MKKSIVTLAAVMMIGGAFAAVQQPEDNAAPATEQTNEAAAPEQIAPSPAEEKEKASEEQKADEQKSADQQAAETQTAETK